MPAYNQDTTGWSLFSKGRGIGQIHQVPRRRATLIRSDIGKVRPSIHKLPDGDIAYGVCITRDEVGADKQIHSWPMANLSSPPQDTRSFVETNRRAVLEAGAVSSSDFRRYQKQHVIRKKPPMANMTKNAESSLRTDSSRYSDNFPDAEQQDPNIPKLERSNQRAKQKSSNPTLKWGNEDGSAGRRNSIPLGSSCIRHKSRSGEYTGVSKKTGHVFGTISPPNDSSAKNCIQADYTNWGSDDSTYPDISKAIQTRRAKQCKVALGIRETRASLGHMRSDAGGTERCRDIPFTMKRFQNIPSSNYGQTADSAKRSSRPRSASSCPTLPSMKSSALPTRPLRPKATVCPESTSRKKAWL
jgi:hypothetical protein